jgi:hypothetical protein
MPFCPKCKYEYRPDIKTCPDCDVALVDNLPEEASAGEPPVAFPDPVCVGSYMLLAQAQMAKFRLESMGIGAVLSNEIISRTTEYAVGIAEGIKVFVAEADAARAVEILEER